VYHVYLVLKTAPESGREGGDEIGGKGKDRGKENGGVI
jgi:hypothetical protein